MKNINIYIFDNDLKEYDEYNPRYVLAKDNPKEILTMISKKKPYTYDERLFNKESLDLLKNISAIKIKNNKICLNFPFFSKKDVLIVKKITKRVIKSNLNLIKNKIIILSEKVKELYPDINPKLSLYHLLCGKMFDGMFFDYLSEKGILKANYIKKDNRDFVLIGYENNCYCNKFNSKLLCSFNNARYENHSLSSFGNASGDRLDYFRFFKLRESNKLYGKFKKLGIILKEESNQTILSEIFKNLDNLKTKNKYIDSLRYTRYINKDNKLIIPVFYNSEEKIKKFSEIVYLELGPIVEESLKKVKKEVYKTNITSIKNDVNKDEIDNELWHIFFGYLNKCLVKTPFIAKPKYHYKEGKYLKCIYL